MRGGEALREVMNSFPSTLKQLMVFSRASAPVWRHFKTNMWWNCTLLHFGFQLVYLMLEQQRWRNGEGRRDGLENEERVVAQKSGQDLWPCSPGLVTCCNWPPEWDRGVWSTESTDQSNGNSTLLHRYTMTSAGAPAGESKPWILHHFLELKLVTLQQVQTAV